MIQDPFSLKAESLSKGLSSSQQTRKSYIPRNPSIMSKDVSTRTSQRKTSTGLKGLPPASGVSGPKNLSFNPHFLPLTSILAPTQLHIGSGVKKTSLDIHPSKSFRGKFTTKQKEARSGAGVPLATEASVKSREGKKSMKIRKTDVVLNIQPNG